MFKFIKSKINTFSTHLNKHECQFNQNDVIAYATAINIPKLKLTIPAPKCVKCGKSLEL